jgi:hypothetical protein
MARRFDVPGTLVEQVRDPARGPATADVLVGKASPGGKLQVTFPADATHFPSYDPNCADTSATGNCPLYPGVAGPSPFLAGATTSFRAITGMAVNGIFEGYRWYDKHNVTRARRHPAGGAQARAVQARRPGPRPVRQPDPARDGA